MVAQVFESLPLILKTWIGSWLLALACLSFGCCGQLKNELRDENIYIYQTTLPSLYHAALQINKQIFFKTGSARKYFDNTKHRKPYHSSQFSTLSCLTYKSSPTPYFSLHIYSLIPSRRQNHSFSQVSLCLGSQQHVPTSLCPYNCSVPCFPPPPLHLFLLCSKTFTLKLQH